MARLLASALLKSENEIAPGPDQRESFPAYSLLFSSHQATFRYHPLSWDEIMNSDPVTIWEGVLRSHYWDDLLALAGSNSSKSLNVKFSDLERHNPEFSREILDRPEQMLGAARAALLRIDLPADTNQDGVQVRIIGLPVRFKIGQLSSAHVDRLIAIEGTVLRADRARSRRVSSAVLLCLRCGGIFLEDLAKIDREDPDVRCPNQECGRSGPFRPLVNNSRYVTAQRIRLQECPGDIRNGVQPWELDVELEDDMVGVATPGDRIIVNGVLKFHPRKAHAIKSIDFDLFFKGVSVENLGVGV
jgi:replicative DNA helicase Mcm